MFPMLSSFRNNPVNRIFEKKHNYPTPFGKNFHQRQQEMVYGSAQFFSHQIAIFKMQQQYTHVIFMYIIFYIVGSYNLQQSKTEPK